MKERLHRLVMNDRLTRVAHWTVFSVGAMSLAFSVIATAARAL